MESKFPEVCILEISSGLSKVFEILNKNPVEIVFLVEKRKFIGSITNGDIRRAMAGGATIESSIYDIANLNSTFVEENASAELIYRSFNNGVKWLPVLNPKKEIIEILSKNSERVIPISEPDIGPREIDLVNEVLTSNWISSSGIYINEFEKKFEEFTGAKHALSVCNGTQAIALALSALGVKSGDEVIVPALTFGATANAVIQIGAIPVFVDVEEDSYALSPKLIEKAISPKTKAIIVVHLYGKPARLSQIQEIANTRGIFLIEDCAEAIGTTITGKHVGSLSDAGTFSFFANKTVTTGEGGMVTFKDSEIFKTAKLIRSHGFDPSERYWHKVWGTNMRLTNIQAAIGVGQMERVESFIESKRRSAALYNKLFENLNLSQILKPHSYSWGNESNWLYVLELSQEISISELSGFLSQKRIETRRVFHPLPKQPAFKSYINPPQAFPISEIKYNQGLCLPSSTRLKDADIRTVVDEIACYLRNTNNQFRNF